ncbi:MAG: DUF3455 domain-containing protein [Deltaproteobacteria bacterium]|nr:DUF3455 domain-containing protein [Nannocystaceae bacterium]
MARTTPTTATKRHIAARRLLPIALSATITPVLALASPQQALAHHDIDVPSHPASIAVPPGNKVYRVDHAIGTQDYVCLPSGLGYAWTFFGPQATLYKDDDKQVMTHFLSPDPSNVARPTWQYKDNSRIWGAAVASASSVTDPAFVDDGSIPWLLVIVVDAEPGLDGGDKLVDTTYIQRLDTSEGVAPAAGCAAAADIGKKALVPYTTDYYFYRADD